jgi:hypothetical protein
MYETIGAISFFIAGYFVSMAVRAIIEMRALSKLNIEEEDRWML